MRPRLYRYDAPGGRTTRVLELGPVSFDSLDASVSVRTGPNSSRTLLALRCSTCGRFTLGCSRGCWFCGVCPACKDEQTEDDAS